MTATATLEELLHEALDRLARQERRIESLEATLHRSAPTRHDSSSASSETPSEIRWPKREIPAPSPDRVAELEERVREAEERLRVTARLETLGRLVAGVSHDFNNLLTVITGCADAILTALPDGHHLREMADLIAETAQTAAGVTRQLVAFGRSPQAPAPCPIDANVAVRTVERALRRLSGERVKVEFLPAESVPLICADPGQFDQVLLNLVVNARDAIGGDGAVTIRTSAVTVSAIADRPGWPADVPPGEFLALTVTDTGAGMTPEVLARVFDPFFTTKGPCGTGLGLSTVRDVVRGAAGHVEVESSPGWGTSVRVFWPALAEPAAVGRPLRLLR